MWPFKPVEVFCFLKSLQKVIDNRETQKPLNCTLPACYWKVLCFQKFIATVPFFIYCRHQVIHQDKTKSTSVAQWMLSWSLVSGTGLLSIRSILTKTTGQWAKFLVNGGITLELKTSKNILTLQPRLVPNYSALFSIDLTCIPLKCVWTMVLEGVWGGHIFSHLRKILLIFCLPDTNGSPFRQFFVM